MNSKLIKTSGYIGLFLVFTGISYLLFDHFIPASSHSFLTSVKNNRQKTNESSDLKSDSIYSGPKTEICPINGQLYTQDEKAIWSARRPLMVMIENHEDSRPQSGLQGADIVYEAVAEGGITRFMGVFYCGVIAESESSKYDLGPVRSARTYFLDLASEYSDYPLYTHVGGANCSAATPGSPCTTPKKAQAIEQIAGFGWNDKGTWSDLSQFSLSYKVCRREPERTGKIVNTEHTMYCSSKELYNVAASRGLTNKTEVKNTLWDKNYRPWLFKQADQASSNPSTSSVSFDFWSGYKDYSVLWKYDVINNNYIRTNGGNEHVDFNTQKTITAKNIVIQFVKESRSIDEHLHNLYDMIGSGNGVLLQNGVKTDISWTKTNRVSRTIFKDKSGQEINFVPGNIWVEILPIGAGISYN